LPLNNEVVADAVFAAVSSNTTSHVALVVIFVRIMRLTSSAPQATEETPLV
jgi:hypothetical protein